MHKVVIRFALFIGLLLLARAPVAAQGAITETQSITETQAITEEIPVEVQTTEATTGTVAAPEEAAPAEAPPADVVIAGPVTGANLSPQLQYGLWLIVALVLFGVGFWLQRRGASADKER
jgi:hypothetical protein